MDLQAMMNTWGELDRQARAQYHITLGGAIKLAAQATGNARFADGGYPGKAGSYRGYYSDLALSKSEAPKTAAEFLAQCEAANGATFRGYKGGDYTMGSDTPLWRAEYGDCGDAVVFAELRDGDLVLHCKSLDAD
jgi:hypothetical protein